MNYVMHFCRNKKCNNGWIDKDLTNVKTNPSAWKYCRECAEKLGIDYPLKGIETPSKEQIQLAKKILLDKED